MKYLAVIFPGIGYTVEKPLLSGSIEIAEKLGYEIRPMLYGGFPEKVKGDRKKMLVSFETALAQAQEMLSGTDFTDFRDVLFIGKSIGTVVAADIASRCPAEVSVRFVLYTPLEETFSYPLGEAVVFTGTKDPWVGAGESLIPALCSARGIPCHSFPDANHSLITGNEKTDRRNLQRVMRETELFVLSQNVQVRIQRIRHFEQLLTESEIILSKPDLSSEDQAVLRRNITALSFYYESAEWKQDYAADEAGLLPKRLKRGVLSEDGIYCVIEKSRESGCF